MGPYVLAKLDITSKTQKIWSDTLMIALYHSRGRLNVLQKWVAGDSPLTDKVEQLSSDTPEITLAELMHDNSIVVQINYLYQYLTCLDATDVLTECALDTWYSTPPTYAGSVYKLNIGVYPPVPGYVWPADENGNFIVDANGVVNPSYVYANGVPPYTTLRMMDVVDQP
jgi:hypothetical protein